LKQLRVLHIMDSLGAGGTERAVWDLIRLSNPERVQFRVVTACAEGPGLQLPAMLHAAGVYDRTVRRLSGGPWHARLVDAMPRRARHALWSMLGPYTPSEGLSHACGRLAVEYLRVQPDIIHGHVWYGLRLGAWLKAWTGKPLVYSIWNSPAQLIDDGAEWVLEDYRRLHPVVDAFFVEPTCVPALAALGLPRERIHTFIGGIDFERRVDPALSNAAQSRTEVRQRLGIPNHAPVALSVGRLTRSKGHRFAVEAVAQALRAVPDLHWILLGDGEERGSLEEAATTLGVAGRAHMVGYVEDPCPYYCAADVFLRTFLLEGENRATYDAMAFGLPIVGFDTGHPTDRIPLIGNGVLVRTADVQALSGGIATVLSRPDRGRALGALGQTDARRHLDVREAISMFEAVYSRLTTERTHRGRAA
jgi:glycosyltransferase involved in cell wall biosynthesis